MRKFLLICYLALATIVSASIPQSEPVDPGNVSLSPAAWGHYYATGWLTPQMVMRQHEPRGVEWDFPFESPELWGAPHYVMTQFTPSFAPAAITMTFRVESSPGVEYVSLDVPEAPARFRLVFMTAWPSTNGDPIPFQYQRWWANPTSYRLGSADGKTFTFNVPLDPALWSSVYGRFGTDSDGWFEVAKNSIIATGYTFGGYFFGHGVRINAGSATFILLDYRLEPDPASVSNP